LCPGNYDPLVQARRYRLLGALEVTDGTTALDLGTRKQRSLLAALLLADGQVVTTDRLAAMIWGDDPPDRFEASLQSYVSTLRRTLEPERAPRAAPTLLVTRGSGYALLARPDEVDLRRFHMLVERGREQHAAGELAAAATTLRNALATYAPLLPEFVGEGFRDAAADHVERVHEAALELSYEVRLALGEERLLVTDLEAAVRRHPLNEGMWALLATSRYRLGRQADALRAVADCKRILAEEIGVDPGPRLRRLETDILAHAPHLDRATGRAPSAAVEQGDPLPALPTKPRAATPQHTDPLVGRRDELDGLIDALTDTMDGGCGLVIVEGEPGVGKTRLLEEASGVAAERGAVVVWGRCLAGEGTPAMWPWMQAVGEFLGSMETALRDRWLSGELGRLLEPRGDPVTAGSPTVLPDAGAQFRLFEQAAEVVARLAGRCPVLLVIDDLQWADPASLQLFEHLAGRQLPGTLLVGALRDKAPAPNDELARTLAATSRLPGLRRIRLGPLGRDEVAALVAQETGHRPDAASAAVLRSRTGGNPFFVRELARLLRDQASLDAAGAVPSGVRDVVRGRMAGLDPAAKSLLQIAAVIGREVDLGLLARAAALDVEDCLDLLEPVEALGLMAPSPGDPFSVWFAHDLVRESVAESTPALRVTRLHLKIADAMDSGAADRAAVVERLAHHLWSAGPLAERGRTATALLEAGRAALHKSAYTSSERQLRYAVELARTGGDGRLELDALTLLSSVVGMRVGYVGTDIELLERAEALAREQGEQRRAADFLYARWASYSQGVQLDRSEPLAEQLRTDGEASDDPVLQMYGALAWGIHQWDLGNIGESYRYLTRSDATVREFLKGRPDDSSLRRDLALLNPAHLANITALRGDLPEARQRLDWIERELTGDPYGLMVWGAFAAVIATQAGEPEWAVRVGARCMAADPEFTFVFMGTYQRMAYWWGRTLLGPQPAGATARMRELIESITGDPPRSGMALWHTLLAEALLADGRVDDAGAELDRADHYLQRYGQRYCEGLTLLLRARWLHARGADVATVRAAVERARQLSVRREAFLFVQRADAFEATLPAADS
jgi:DNA-binding SARP family transcriptional activator